MVKTNKMGDIFDKISRLGVKEDMPLYKQKSTVLFNQIIRILLGFMVTGSFAIYFLLHNKEITYIVMGMAAFIVIALILNLLSKIKMAIMVFSFVLPVYLISISIYLKTQGNFQSAMLYFMPRFLIMIFTIISVVFVGFKNPFKAFITSSVGILCFLFFDIINNFFGVGFHQMPFIAWHYNIVTLGISAIFIFILLLIIFLQKINIQYEQIVISQKEDIEDQKDEIIAQRDEIEAHLEDSEMQRVLITHQKKELTDSIRYAQRIQKAILPPEYFVKNCLSESFILYLPKDVVSGDFYYVEKIDDNVIFAAVDCTGHGVPGSMMSVIGYNLINQAVKLNHVSKPSDILSFLDAGVTDTLRQTGGESGVNDGMDLAVCSLNLKTNVLQFAGAYNSVVYIKKNEIFEIKADKLAIGVNYDGVTDVFTNHELHLEKGDLVYLYSDGYADQFGGPAGKKFKYKPLKEVLLKNANLHIDEQKKMLHETFLKWRGDLEQVDDVMVIGVKI